MAGEAARASGLRGLRAPMTAGASRIGCATRTADAASPERDCVRAEFGGLDLLAGNVQVVGRALRLGADMARNIAGAAINVDGHVEYL
jgi:hypothetical protein